MKVFSSVKKAEELWYTRDEGVVPIGELVLELPEVGRMTRDREVEIFFDFSHTEIQVCTLHLLLLCLLVLWTIIIICCSGQTFNHNFLHSIASSSWLYIYLDLGNTQLTNQIPSSWLYIIYITTTDTLYTVHCLIATYSVFLEWALFLQQNYYRFVCKFSFLKGFWHTHTHTHTQVRACEKSSKAEVKAVLDFLSAIPPGQRRKVRVQEEQVMGVDERDGHRKHEDEEEKKNEEEGGRGGRGRIW